MMQSIQPYIETIVNALIGVIALALIAFLREARQKITSWMEANTNQSQRATLHLIAMEGWAYAEKLYTDLKGEDKMKQALLYVYERAREKGIPIDAKAIQNIIEKAVLDYNAQVKSQTPKSPAN